MDIYDSDASDSAVATRDDAQEILDALQQIQASPELRAEAGTDPERVLNRFNLSDVARHAVAFGIAGLLVAPVFFSPENWW
ncbi:MAG: hypothetical protein JO020_23955 [Chloroflexi bacterium]|nr:hypothetical protein [Chloroflexota bacterium]MBV9135331.1 hypothetical protein [Chloroflexota bacterium]MBV9897231.1 hypothetical protein [Chloroflexota bacterium]